MTSLANNIEVKTINHLGIIDEIGIVEIINKQLEIHSQEKLSSGITEIKAVFKCEQKKLKYHELVLKLELCMSMYNKLTPISQQVASLNHH